MGTDHGKLLINKRIVANLLLKIGFTRRKRGLFLRVGYSDVNLGNIKVPILMAINFISRVCGYRISAGGNSGKKSIIWILRPRRNGRVVEGGGLETQKIGETVNPYKSINSLYQPQFSSISHLLQFASFFPY